MFQIKTSRDLQDTKNSGRVPTKGSAGARESIINFSLKPILYLMQYDESYCFTQLPVIHVASAIESESASSTLLPVAARKLSLVNILF